MKLSTRLALCAVALLLVAACGNKGDLVLPTPPEAAPKEAAAPE
jgi:predicted small lipoprotein YifL